MARPPATARSARIAHPAIAGCRRVALAAKSRTRPQRAEVAAKAGVAKGTVYLYFKSKEDLLLAAHARHVQAFFTALIERASQRKRKRMNFDDMMRLTRDHIVSVSAFLPLATLVAGLRHKGVTPEAAEAFDQRIAEQLMAAGSLAVPPLPLARCNQRRSPADALLCFDTRLVATGRQRPADLYQPGRFRHVAARLPVRTGCRLACSVARCHE